MTDNSEPNQLSQLEWSAVSDMGRRRKNNEDAFLAVEMDAREVHRLGKYGKASLRDGDLIFAVSDGMGGHNAGEFASNIAVEKITQLLPTAFRLEAEGLHRGESDLLIQLFDDIHREIVTLGEAYQELKGMGATLSLCWFHPERMHFCHIGDSRIYLLPKQGGIKQISEDHTYVAWLVRTGKLAKSQARYHPRRNQISQALTANARNIDPQVGAVTYEPGDRFVICSDGLNDGLSDNGIDNLIRDRPKRVADLRPAEAIVKESVAASGKDNTTAVVIEVVES